MLLENHARRSMRLFVCVLILSLGSTWAERKRVPYTDDVLDEIVPIQVTRRFLPMGTEAVYSGRFLDRNGRRFFWFSLSLFQEGYSPSKSLIEGEYAFQAEPVSDKVISLWEQNHDLTAGQIARQLKVERFSVSGDSCPQLKVLINELDYRTIPVDLPKGVFLDTESYRFGFQTGSGSIRISYLGPFPKEDANSYLIEWFGRVQNLLRGACSAERVEP